MKQTLGQPDVFARLRPWAPEELLTFLDQIAVLFPEELKHRLKQVVDSIPPEGDNMHRVLELVRSQWKDIQSRELVQIAVVGPGQTGKTSLVRTINRHQEQGAEPIFTVVEMPGLEEYLGYQSSDPTVSELRQADVVVLVLDAQYELSEATRQLYERLLPLGRPVLVVLNKMDLVEQSWRTLRQARTALSTNVFPFSMLQPQSANTLLKAIVDANPKTFAPLSQAFPNFRHTICNGVVSQAALAAAVVGAVSIPVSQFLPITAIQTGMLLKIARAFGYPLNRERAQELIPMLALGVVAREAGHRLRVRFPEYKKIVSVSVAGMCTLGLGQAAIYYFEGLRGFLEGEPVRLPVLDAEG